MNLLLDTNILLAIIRDPTHKRVLTFINPNNQVLYTSFIKSIAIQNRWGKNKINQLEKYISALFVLEFNEYLIEPYVEIDTFGQRRNPGYEKYDFKTPRNMGKNDLWIAATASFLNLTLVTTDHDFDHLDGTFIELKKNKTN